jgi:hypothetical protein
VLAALAGWRVSLHRTRADWPIVAAAWLSTLLAAALLSIGPIYASATSLAGIRRALADAPRADTIVSAAYYAPPAAAAKADAPVRRDLEAAIEPLGGKVLRDVQSTESFAIGGRAEGAVEDRALLGFAEGIADHATLSQGAWPVDSAAAEPMQVAVLDAVADRLRLKVGAELPLVVREFNQESEIRTQVVGIFTIDGQADAYWQGDAQLATGVAEHGSYRTLGPLLTTPVNVLQRAPLASVQVRWRAFPKLDRLTVDESPGLRSRLAALPDVLQTAAGAKLDVRTGLPPILDVAERSLQVSGASVLLLMLQLAILAAYAIVLTASLLVDHRRVDTAMLRSRGAGPIQLTLLSLAETLLLAIPAVLLAPWLAAAALAVLNTAGPLADVGLSIEPHVTPQAYLAAAAAGVVCLGLMVVPVLIGARRFADAERELSRQETRTFGHRMGLDVALVAISAIALWQLRSYGAPLTTSVRGSLGVDPLLIAAPAIGLLAGGVLALRIMPLLASVAERAVSRGRDLVTSLGVQQLARRPLRYTRSALLLMIAISTGVFALSYAATWSTSQHDQADFQSGAALRVVPGDQVGALPSWALPAAYAGLPGVNALSPVERRTDGLAVGATSGDVLAIDADAAPDIVLMRPDQAAGSLAELMRPLQAGRPEPKLAQLPAGATALRVVPRLDILSAKQFVAGGPFEFHTVPIDPSLVTGIQVSVTVTLRDARGLLYQVDSAQQPLTRRGRPIVISLQPGAADEGLSMAGPLEVAELSVDLWLAEDIVVSNGSVGVGQVSAAGGPDGPWRAVALDAIGPWRATQVGLNAQQSVAADLSDGITLPLSGGGAQGNLFGNGLGGPPAHVVLVPKAIESLANEVRVIADRTFLAAADAAVGDSVTVRLDGLPQSLVIAGSVEAFPGTDSQRAVVVLDEPTFALLRLQATNTTRDADEWWFAASDQAAPQLAAALAAPPFSGSAVLTAADRAQTLGRDPVAVGILGALALGFVAAALFAIVGLVVSAAVSARQRQSEFAVLRALGLSGGQLSRWLWLENGSVVAISVVGGTALGLLIGWLVLPFVTVTQQGTAPVPAVIVEIPWERIAILDVSGALVLAVAVATIGSLLRRRGVGSTLRMGDD